MIGPRLKLLLAERRISQSELARRVGLQQSTINGLVSGDQQSTTKLHHIARELGTTPAYLIGETDDSSEGAQPTPSPQSIAEHLDVVPIALIDLAYGMGGTFTDNPVDQQMLHFPRGWVEAITSTPAEMLTFARGRGDSMTPTIQDDDLVLIDRSQRRPREQDVIWALTVGDIGMIKRLRIRGGGVTILSDNDRVPPDEATGDEVRIVGRVIFIGRKL